jgi:uncharacterized protein involved in exopolysaccharide biosynthesis
VSPQLTKLKVEAQAAELRANTLASLFTQAREQGTGGASVEVLSAASSASSDRGHFLQRLIAAGLIGGLFLGVALAALRSRRLTTALT